MYKKAAFYLDSKQKAAFLCPYTEGGFKPKILKFQQPPQCCNALRIFFLKKFLKKNQPPHTIIITCCIYLIIGQRCIKRMENYVYLMTLKGAVLTD